MKKISLSSRMALVISTVIIASFACFGTYTALKQDDFAEQGIKKVTQAVADNVAAAVAGDILEGRYDRIEALLINLSMIGSVRELTVVDANGKIVAKVVRNGSDSGKPDYSAAGKNLVPSLQAINQTEEQYSYTRSIDRGERIGMVTVKSSTESLAIARKDLYADILRATLIAVVISMILVGFSLHGTIKALHKATRFADLIVNHRGESIHIESNVREVNDLMHALNHMSSALALQHQQLLDTEVRKSAILDAALDCIITIDENGLIIDFNHAAESTFGYGVDDVRGKPMDEVIIPQRLRKAHRHGMARYVTTGQATILGKRIELTAQRRSGEEFPVELAIVPFVIAGRPYFSGYLRDISKRKAMEEESVSASTALKKLMRELYYQNFALDQHAMVSIADALGNITYVNKKFCEISGYDASELMGANHRLIKSEVHEPSFFVDMWEHISTGKVWHGQIADRRKDGTIQWSTLTIVPWLDENDLPYQYVAIRTDITEQKASEHALEESRKRELETGNEIQRALLWGAVPEDLRNVIIATYSEASQGIDGDFFAFNRYSGACFELLVGDVMGKGIHAALIGAAVKNTYNQVLVELLVDSLGQNHLPTPATIVNALHHSLTPHLIILNSFVTLALYRFDLIAGTLTYVNAGHTPGLLARACGGAEFILGDNLPIGVVESECYTQISLAIFPGDALLAYSDGITETRNNAMQDFGETRFADLIVEGRLAGLPPSLILQSMRRTLQQFSEHEKLSDDQTAVMVELLPGEGLAPRSDGCNLPAKECFEVSWQLDALAPIRARIGAAGSGLSEAERNGLILATFEAATNIIRHVPRPFPDSTLICCIATHSASTEVELLYVGNAFSPPALIEPDLSGEHDGGFGLFIIEQSVHQVVYGNPTANVCSIRLTQNYPDTTKVNNV